MLREPSRPDGGPAKAERARPGRSVTAVERLN